MQKNVVFLKTVAGLGTHTGIQHTGLPVIPVSEQDNGNDKKGKDRALFTTMCVAVQLPDIFTTTKPLVLISL
ncbi:hypothetical protein E2C01_038511 [Portunus trituberculatus]|uniref:Uncharacterized protein n=1 Tax=Portunus trituberculatus TaxID=210409 RepID=A0A5B7FEC6_PORTR|nr:hypothetical protein [Portunus trituberculatus]